MTVTFTDCDPVSPPLSVTRAVIEYEPGFEIVALADAPFAMTVVPFSSHWMLELMLPCCVRSRSPRA